MKPKSITIPKSPYQNQYRNFLGKNSVSVLVTEILLKTWLTNICRPETIIHCPKMAKTVIFEIFCPKTVENMENCVSETHTDMKSGKQLMKLKPKTFIGGSHYQNQNPKPLLIRAATKIKTKNQNLEEPLLKSKPKTKI